MDQSRDFPKSLKGSNKPPVDVVKGSGEWKDGPSSSGANVSIITGSFRNSVKYPSARENEACLLMRFHGASTEMSPRNVQDMYNKILKRCPLEGYEKHRRGGSSGIVEPDEHFWKCFHQGKALPKKTSGVKFLFEGTRVWCCYINDKGQVVKKEYSRPVRGGPFDVDPELLEEFPALAKFAEYKAYAALILKELNERRKIKITPEAVEQELDMIRRSAICAIGAEAVRQSSFSLESSTASPPRKVFLANVGDVATPRSRSQADSSSIMDPNMVAKARTIFLANYASSNKHTMVCHPVGYHTDFFANGKTSLENKELRVHPGLAPQMGRGGAGGGKYVFALLDWVNENSGRRRRVYLANGGNRESRVTESVWQQFLLHNPRVAEAYPEGIPSG